MLRPTLQNVFQKYATPMLPPPSAPAAPKPALTPPLPTPAAQGIKNPTAPTTPAAPAVPQPQPAPAPAPATPGAAMPPVKNVPAPPPPPGGTTSAPAGQQPAQPQPATPQQPAGSNQPQTPAPMDAAAIMAQLPKNTNIPPEQQQAFASGLAESVKGKEGLIAGAKAFSAGENSPAAKEFQAHMQQFEQKWIQEHMQQLAAANPGAAATPQGWGGLFQQATSAWQQMPTEMKWITGLGLGGGLLGLASSIFGEGGMGMGLLGLLGIGVGGLAGAAGGLFGQDVQKGTSDMAFNAGSFLGFVPDAGSLTGKLNDLKNPNYVAEASTPTTLGEKVHTFLNAETEQQAIRKKLEDLERAKKFMMIPEAMRLDWLRKLDTTLTPEEAQIVGKNLAGLVAEANNPQSPLAQKIESGKPFAAAEDPNAYVNQQATNAIVNKAVAGWNSASNALGDAWNWAWGTQPPPADPRVKVNADMTLLRLIEKWAFNDMDAKELGDLKQQNAQGVSYRVEDARRLNELEKRRWADGAAGSQPVTKQIAISVCQKAARCWAGYEPVPGAKAYSRGSCRPKGSKKTQKEMKKS